MNSKDTLSLQTDVIEKQPEVTTSLCDRFGINMYSDIFLNLEVQYYKQRKETQNELLQGVMKQSKVDTKEVAFQQVLTAEIQAVQKRDYTENITNTPIITSYFYLGLGILLAGIILYYIEKKRRSKKIHEDYSDHYQW